MNDLRGHSNERIDKRVSNRIVGQMNVLLSNLQNHLNNKVKISFIPNEYYNDKIYILVDYSSKRDTFGQTLELLLKDNDSMVNFSIENIVDLKVNEYFNRIEYSLKVMSLHDDCYNFCLYY